MVADKEPATRIIEDFPTVDKTNRIEYDNETVKHKTDKKTVNKSI